MCQQSPVEKQQQQEQEQKKQEKGCPAVRCDPRRPVGVSTWTACVRSGAGTLKNDVIQFTVVELNNVDPNNHVHFELTKKLALQLEGIGMRTSYREVSSCESSTVLPIFRRDTKKNMPLPGLAQCRNCASS